MKRKPIKKKNETVKTNETENKNSSSQSYSRLYNNTEFKLINELNWYKEAFEMNNKSLDDIWKCCFGDIPVCDTGNCFNTTPIIRDRVISYINYKRKQSKRFYWSIVVVTIASFLLGALIF